MPLSDRTVAIDNDYRIHHMMDSEGEDLRCMVEKAADIFTTLGLAEFAAVPDSIVGKEAGDGIRPAARLRY